MNERYTKLFALPENLYTESAPVVIAAGALLKDNQTGKILAQIKYKNISSKIIKAVKVAVRAFDVSGTEIESVAEYQYLDLSAARDTEFGQKNAILLPNAVTRSFSCECKSIIFADGTSWEETGAEWTPLAEPKLLTQKLGGLAAQYQRETIGNAQFVTTDDRDLWICACGAINRQDEEKCHTCRSEKSALLAALDTDILKKHNEDYNKAKAEQEAKQAAETKIKKAKTKKISIIAAACAVVVIAAIVVIAQIVVPPSKYNSAVALMNEGKYEEALKEFEDLSGYKDSADMISETKYQWAISLLGNDDQDAYEIFIALGDYKDCQEYLDKFELYLVEECSDSYSAGLSYVITYEYDDNNNLILSTTEYDTSSSTTVYEYSDDNVLIKSTYASENSNGTTSTIVREYDEYGNIIRQAFNDSSLSSSTTTSTTTNSYTYYENGKPKTCETCETVIFKFKNTIKNTRRSFYTYDENGGYSKEIRSTAGEIIANYQLECDSHGNAISYKKVKDGEIIDIEYACSNTYDENGNLTEKKYLTYDENGNLTKEKDLHGYTYKWEYDENNLVRDQYIYKGDKEIQHITYMYGYFYTK